jgi:hypothetical protein
MACALLPWFRQIFSDNQEQRGLEQDELKILQISQKRNTCKGMTKEVHLLVLIKKNPSALPQEYRKDDLRASQKLARPLCHHSLRDV